MSCIGNSLQQIMGNNVFDDTVSASARYNPYSKKYEVRRTVPPTARRYRQMTFNPFDDNDLIDGMRWIGDDLSSSPCRNNTRIMLHNCNSLAQYSRDTNLVSAVYKNWLQKDVHVMALTETRLNRTNHRFSDMSTLFRNTVRDGDIAFANTPGYKSKTISQPGGVGIGFHGRIQQRFEKFGYDKLGRWVYAQFTGNTKTFRIYSLYRVNGDSDSTSGDTTAWTQQRDQLLQSNIGTNPRKQVIIDLCLELHSLIENEYDIMVLGDLNETIDSKEGTNELFRNIGLLNIMEHRVGTDLPKTHRRGSAAIDHCWGTHRVVESVSQAGYAPFEYLDRSDHRPLFLDIDIKCIIENELSEVKRPNQRRLKMNATKRVLKYIENIESQWEYHNISDRVNALIKLNTEDLTHIEEQLNAIDTQISEIMNSSERKCSKISPLNTHAWSTKLDEAAMAVYQARYDLNQAKKTYVGAVVPEVNLHEAEQTLTVAKETYSQVKKNDKKHRREHLRERARVNTVNGIETDISKEIKKLAHIEDQTFVSNRINNTLKKNNFDTNNGLLIPDITSYPLEQRSLPEFDHWNVDTIWDRIQPKNGKDILRWERVTKKSDIHDLLIKWQCRHFMQAAESPFASHDWASLLLQEDVQDKILSGEFEPPDTMPLSPTAREYLRFLKRDPVITSEIPFDLSFDEFCTFVKKAREKTSCSPSGRTYSHYKALLQHNRIILGDIFKLLCYSMRNNIVLDRWKQTTTVLLLKDAGKPKIHRMRTIHIIESELQFISKIFYVKKMMGNAERLNLVTDEQYGARPNRQAQSAVLNKRLYYNITHQMRHECAFMDDDAKACYDRIVTGLSAVEGRKWGQSHRESVFTTKVLQSQLFRVRTFNGTTDATYSYSDATPLQGAGQGIGWAGPKWVNTSDTCSKMMNSTCTGMVFQDPFGMVVVVKIADYFVDDTATGVTETAVNDDRSVLEHLSETEQKHADILYVCGHKLALDKCVYYFSRFKRVGLVYRHTTIEETPGDLVIRDSETGKVEKIQRLEPMDEHVTLGHLLSLTGSNKDQYNTIRDAMRDWTNKINTSSLTGRERMQAYTGYLEKALQYVVASTTFSFKQCNTLMRIVAPVLLNANSIQRNCARIVLFSTPNFGGLGIKHLFHLQGLERLRFLTMHMRRQDTVGDLMTICIQNTQLELGVSKQFFLLPFPSYSFVCTPTWITDIWEYVHKCHGTAHIPFLHMQHLQRQNDFFLMDKVFESQHTSEHIHIFNHVRIALKVITASDIVTLGSNAHVLRSVRKGCIKRRSKLQWPKSENIPAKWLEVWNCILDDVIIPHLLRYPLGNWIAETHQVWDHHTNQSKDAISDPHHTYSIRRRTRYSNYDLAPEYLPLSIPCDVLPSGDTSIQCLGAGSITYEKEVPQVHKSIRDAFKHVSDWRKRNWGQTFMKKAQVKKMLSLLRRNKLCCCSDGSVNYNRSGHAWGIAVKGTAKILISGAAPVDGIPSKLNSTRAEMLGIIACVTFLSLISDVHKIRNKTIVLYTDSEAAITLATTRGLLSTKYSFHTDIDVILELRESLRLCPHKIILEYVEGHQDKTTPYELLDYKAKLNVQMDRLVGKFMTENPEPWRHRVSAPLFPTQRVCFRIRGVTITSHFEDCFIDSFNEKARRTYMLKHIGTDRDTGANWEYVSKVLRSDRKCRSKYIKYIHNQTNTMDVCERWKTSTDALCPLCKNCRDHTGHTITCTHIEIKRARALQVQSLKSTLTKHRTDPILKQYMLSQIHRFISNSDMDIYTCLGGVSDEFSSLLHQAHDDQCCIGWKNFFKGLLSPKWGAIQKLYYDANLAGDNKYNMPRWMRGITKSMLHFSYSLWKERCSIVQAEQNSTAEARTRRQAYDYCCLVRREIWKLNVRDRHLIRRQKQYFRSTPLTQILSWEQRLRNALKRANEYRSGLRGELTHWTIPSRREIQNSVKTVLPTKIKNLKQLTLFGNTLQRTSQQNSCPRAARLSRTEIRVGRNNTRERVSSLSLPSLPSRNPSRRTHTVQQNIRRWLTFTHSRLKNSTVENTNNTNHRFSI